MQERIYIDIPLAERGCGLPLENSCPVYSNGSNSQAVSREMLRRIGQPTVNLNAFSIGIYGDSPIFSGLIDSAANCLKPL